MNPLTWIKDVLSSIVGAVIGGAVIFVISWLYWEGVPIGPLRYIPGIHYVFPEGKVERVRRETNEQCAGTAEIASLKAQLAEKDRQLSAAAIAAMRYSTLAQEAQTRENALIEADAIEDAKFTEQLRAAGRACVLDQSDINYIYGVRK